ncbi:hypothetical protein ES703_61422 [subsurface metagenome]
MRSHRKRRLAVASNNNDSLVLSPAEVRKCLKISRSVLYSSLKNGTIPSIKISPRKIIIPRRRFLEWLNGGGGENLHLQE